MALTIYSKETLLNRYKNTGATAPTTHYIGLNSADSEDGSGEITATYLPARATYTATNYSAPATIGLDRVIKNSVEAALGTSIAASPIGGIPNFSIWDAVTGGNCLYVGTFENSEGTANPLTFGDASPVAIPIDGIILKLSIAGFGIAELDTMLGFFKGTNLVALANTYAGIFTALANDGTGTEVTPTVRVAGRLTIPPTSWGAIATSGIIRRLPNSTSIDFGASAGSAGFVSQLGIFDAATAGNLIGIGNISANIGTGDPVLVAVNQLNIDIS
jgi:hypothetical protein